MPVDLDNHDPTDPVNVRPGTNEAEGLCFLYANPDYGFQPAEVRDHTDIPNNSAYKALTRLHEKDLIGKTSDGYYHALDDAHVASHADALRRGEEFDIDHGPEPYPDDVDETTQGHPEEGNAHEDLIEGRAENGGQEPYPDDIVEGN